jgi:hypothetical protein
MSGNEEDRIERDQSGHSDAQDKKRWRFALLDGSKPPSDDDIERFKRELLGDSFVSGQTPPGAQGIWPGHLQVERLERKGTHMDLEKFDKVDIEKFAALLEEQVGVKVLGTSLAGHSGSYEAEDEQGSVIPYDIHTFALVFTTTEPDQDELIDDDLATTFIDTNFEYVKKALDAASDTAVELLNADEEELMRMMSEDE